jgi:hypothetical protein
MIRNCYLDSKDLELLKEIVLRGELTAKDAEQIYELSTEATWMRLSFLVANRDIFRTRHGRRFYYSFSREESDAFEERVARLFSIVILAVKRNQIEIQKLQFAISSLESSLVKEAQVNYKLLNDASK